METGKRQKQIKRVPTRDENTENTREADFFALTMRTFFIRDGTFAGCFVLWQLIAISNEDKQ